MDIKLQPSRLTDLDHVRISQLLSIVGPDPLVAESDLLHEFGLSLVEAERLLTGNTGAENPCARFRENYQPSPELGNVSDSLQMISPGALTRPKP